MGKECTYITVEKLNIGEIYHVPYAFTKMELAYTHAKPT
jgi:hypothetical protein